MRFGKEDCKECFLRGCDCECTTCVAAKERNEKMTNLELTRLSAYTALERSNITNEGKKRVTRMLKGQGL